MSYAEIKTPALVLKTYSYEERKLIAHFYTRAMGRQTLLISGPKHRSHCQRGALLMIRFYHRPQRDVQRLSEVDWLFLYKTLHHEPSKAPYLLLILEVLDQVLVAPDDALFDYVAWQLRALDAAIMPQAMLGAFLTGLIKRLGGHAPALPTDWPTLEAAFASAIPNWKPLQMVSLLSTLNLPLHERDQ